MSAGFRFDKSARDTVVVCREAGCGAREVCVTRTAADRWARDHLDVCEAESAATRRRVLASLHERDRRA